MDTFDGCNYFFLSILTKNLQTTVAISTNENRSLSSPVIRLSVAQIKFLIIRRNWRTHFSEKNLSIIRICRLSSLHDVQLRRQLRHRRTTDKAPSQVQYWTTFKLISEDGETHIHAVLSRVSISKYQSLKMRENEPIWHGVHFKEGLKFPLHTNDQITRYWHETQSWKIYETRNYNIHLSTS